MFTIRKLGITLFKLPSMKLKISKPFNAKCSKHGNCLDRCATI